MPTKEERFKAFLNSLPEDKRRALFDYFKRLTPDERVKAIDKILLTAEQKSVSGNTKIVSDISQKSNEISFGDSKGNVPASATPNVKPAEKKAVKIAERPVEKKVEKKAETKATNPDVKPAEKKTEAKKANAPEAKTEQKKAPSKKVSPLKKNLEVSPKTKRDLVVVAVVLVVFIALCVVVKMFIEKKLENKVEETIVTSESVVETQEAVPSEETTIAETTEVTPEVTPEPERVAIKADAPDLTGMIIVIDPGHQMNGNDEEESLASWLSTTKKKATPGAVGIATGVKEYELTLDIALIMKDYLEQCGATVILTREENDVNISNQERALVAVENNADLFIRLHTDAANDSYTSGVRVFVPNIGDYTSQSSSWGDSLGNKVAGSLGLTFIGTKSTELYAGLNYANTVRAFQISLGLLSNSDDEEVLTNEENQIEIAAAVSEFAAELK